MKQSKGIWMTENVQEQPAKKPYHTPRLIEIRGRDASQTKSGAQPFEGGKPKPGSEHLDGDGKWHGPGQVGPS